VRVPFLKGFYPYLILTSSLTCQHIEWLQPEPAISFFSFSMPIYRIHQLINGFSRTCSSSVLNGLPLFLFLLSLKRSLLVIYVFFVVICVPDNLFVVLLRIPWCLLCSRFREYCFLTVHNDSSSSFSSTALSKPPLNHLSKHACIRGLNSLLLLLVNIPSLTQVR